jgi:hypothetical protein
VRRFSSDKNATRLATKSRSSFINRI